MIMLSCRVRRKRDLYASVYLFDKTIVISSPTVYTVYYTVRILIFKHVKRCKKVRQIWIGNLRRIANNFDFRNFNGQSKTI